MWRCFIQFAFGCATMSVVLAGSAHTPALKAAVSSFRETESPEKLRERAEAAKGGERAKLYMRAAEKTVEEANAKFTAGEIEQAHGQVKQAVSDADRATDAARTSGKRLKNTELELRKLVRRLTDIERTLAVDDRGPVHESIEHLQELNRSLLDRMFGRGGK
jgi:hypothetical protein